MDINEIKEAAIEEVLNPTFELTKQYLNSNELCYKVGLPVAEDIIINKQENVAYVYFPIAEESFYLTINIDLEDECPSFIYMSAGNRVYLSVSSEEHDLDELLNVINIEPTRKWGKGEKRGKHGQYTHSGFIYEPMRKMTGEIDDKLRVIVNELQPSREMIFKLLDIADVEIQVSYHGYKSEMWGIHLESDLIRDLSMLNLSLDIDLYASGKDLVD